MSNHTTYRSRSTAQQLQGFRRFMSVSILMSLAVVFFGMQLMMVGPLKGRLDRIQTRLDLSDHSMKKLVSVRDSVWRANDLLSSLEEQSGRLDNLQQSIVSMESLRNRVNSEVAAAEASMKSLDSIQSLNSRLAAGQQDTVDALAELAQLSELRSQVIAAGEQTHVADNSFSGMVALQNRVIAASNGYEKASASIAGLTDLTHRMIAGNEELQQASAQFDNMLALQQRMVAAAEGVESAGASLAQLDDLTRRMGAESSGIQVAARQFDEFAGLKDAITATAVGMDDARTAAGQLTALKDQILAGDDNVQVAEQNARVLVAMNEALGQSLNLAQADQNLQGMLALQKSLTDQTGQLAAAAQNLEILEGFRGEMSTHIAGLDRLRRQFVELAMMETTVGRVARMIRPLAEMGSLSHLDDADVRAAARMILERRRTRLSQNDSASVVTSSDSESLVPLPPEARQ